MDMIRLEGLSHSWGGPPLLDGLDLVLREGDRLCLVGRNGAGKSTLLGIIEGRIVPEGGVVWRQESLRTASLPQDVPEERSGDLLSAVLHRAGPAGEALLDHAGALLRLEADPADEGAMQALERASAAIDKHNGWQVRQQVDEVLDLLDLDPAADLGEASGGTVRRVLLAGALASDPDVLILDEPTNHLDIPTVERLEALLRRRRGALIFISHDRAFIDALATRVVELDRGALQCEAPNFDAHLQLRDAHLAVEADHRAAFDRNLAEEEAWLRQGVKARRTRNEGRVRRLEALRRERAQRRERAGQARITVQEAERSGRLVIEAKDVDWAWDGKTVLSGFSTTVLRGDKVGIIGPNGCGKTTLLRLLLGKLEPQRGSIRLGTNLQLAYFDQLREELNPDLSVWENVADGNDHITVDGRRRHVLGWLSDFLFRPERARSPVRVLSGGERHRLLLARLFTRPANLLVLDEPTNDLDMETLELLEDRLVSFEGTLLVVSHDRAFLNRVVSSTIAWEEGRGFQEYVGGYDDWVRQRPDPAPGSDAAMANAAPSPAAPSAALSSSPSEGVECIATSIDLEGGAGTGVPARAHRGAGGRAFARGAGPRGPQPLPAGRNVTGGGLTAGNLHGNAGGVGAGDGALGRTRECCGVGELSFRSRRPSSVHLRSLRCVPSGPGSG